MTNWADEHGSDISSYEDSESHTDNVAVRALGESPIVGGFMEHGINNSEGIANDESTPEEIVGGVVGLAGSVADFGFEIHDLYGSLDQETGKFEAGTFKEMLTNFGLDMALQFIPGLEDALHQVSGSPDDMQDHIDQWQKINVALGELSDEIADSALGTLQNWSGTTADTAAEKVERLCQGIMAMSKSANSLQAILSTCQALCNLIFSVIKELLAKFINYLLWTGIPALKAAVPTKGASIVKWLISAAKKAMKDMATAAKKMFSSVSAFKEAAMSLGKALVKQIEWGDAFKDLAPESGNVVAHVGSAMTSNSMSSDESIARGSMSGGFDLDLADFDAAADALKEHSANANEILQEASQISSDDVTWGVTGIFFKTAYDDEVRDYVEDLGSAVDAIDGCCTRLQDNCTAYQDCDDEAARALDDLDARMD